MNIEERIDQFEHMTREDPGNDMAHFSLAGAYAQVDRHSDAARAYLQCVDINPAMSKARQLAGASLISADEPKQAAWVLTTGYIEANKRGDLAPRNAMGDMLRQLGEPVPEVEQTSAPAPAPTGEGGFICARSGQSGSQLEEPPFRGPVGQWIYEHISQETWQTWISQGTKVINELRLDLSREEDAAAYDQNMHDFLGMDEALLNELRGEPAA